MYHNIDNHDRESRLSVSPESFERQMAFLRKQGYNVVPLNKLIDIISSKKSIPPKTVAITLDDGYENNYTNAFPILKKYNIPATIFVVVEKIGQYEYLNWDQLKEMSHSGIDIGSHQLSHTFLPNIKDDTRLSNEIYVSRQIIRSHIPLGAETFAYCGGGFNEKARQAVIEAGYKGACATNPGKNYPKHDIYALKRLRISKTSDNLFVFWIETNGLYTWVKEHRDKD
jgi:peptidoglycan/xylan/chitin deacetylase (PgdA/CDA1 family)